MQPFFSRRSLLRLALAQAGAVTLAGCSSAIGALDSSSTPAATGDSSPTGARGGPVVLAGSSLGAYISAIASLHVPTRALFLMVPPTRMGAMPALDAAPVPTSVVHAWHDELIPADEVIAWARARSARLLLLDDTHRLAAHVDTTARAFAELLQSL